MAVGKLETEAQLLDFIREELVGTIPERLEQVVGLLAPPKWLDLPTLQNGWTVYSGTGDAKYTKDGAGYVQCRGELSAGTVTIDTLLWTFPNGFKPAIRSGCACWYNLDAGRIVYVNANGEVRLGYALTAAGVLNLNGIRFPTF